jgi:hypothetical protein
MSKSISTLGIHKILRDYLQDGMCWSDKKTKPIVVIHNVNNFPLGMGIFNDSDKFVNDSNYIKVEYSVFISDKKSVSSHMENISCHIDSDNLVTYIRDYKLNSLEI